MSIGRWTEVGRMDELARRDSPMHRLDARAKALTTIVFIVVVMSFPRYDIAALMPFFLYPFVLVAVGDLPVGFLFRRILVAAPFAILIGIFNPLLDRTPRLFLGEYAITGGWVSFASILLRFFLTVSAALALIACTGMHRLCAGLERMGLPRVFAAQLLFLYRYLFVVAHEGSRMVRGFELRSYGAGAPRLRVYSSLLGHLLLRSMDRGQGVHRAMLARGFDGEIRVLRGESARPVDFVFFVGWTAFFVAARVWNLADLLGRVVLPGG
ncbi:cobalt ECF transporter T component CbiQ [Candidatus Sumerlaeota bacterium]|nr:cobalt ECF transporter T component CbiQ [Candidatus Sumerlaeota bacterium]